MAKASQPRAGSLQFWPRKRISKFIPSVNWPAITSDKKLLGFIGYKVSMANCLAKDLTPNSLTKDQKIFMPVTIVELPGMKILSVRFYKQGKVMKDVLAENLDKDLKRKIKLPKAKPGSLDAGDADDIRIMVYSKARNIKKTPDIAELALSGSLDEKLAFVKDKMNKEILASEILKDVKTVDIRGLTKGKGTEGPVKRFGIKERQHKSEKGVRRPGTLGPWHPAHVQFRVPIQGQLGMFTRIQYNSSIIYIGKINEKNINPNEGWKNFGKINTEYAIIRGSVQGPYKRQMLLTMPLRPTKKQTKKNFEFIRMAEK